MACRPACLGDDASDLDTCRGGLLAGALGGLAARRNGHQRQRLRRQDLGRDQDHGLGGRQRRRPVAQGELGQEAADHIADVSHPLLEILVGDAGEQLGVLFQGVVQGGAGVDLTIANDGLDLANQGRVAQQQAVGAKDGRLFLAELAGDALDDRVQLAGGGVDGVLEALNFGRDGGDLEVGRLPASEHLVDAKGAGDGNAR